MIDKDKLQQIRNKSTGNTFPVVGANEDLAVGARIYYEYGPDTKYYLGLRVRVQQFEGHPQPLDFGKYCKARLPNVKWSKMSGNYCSIAINFCNVPKGYTTQDVMTVLTDANVVAQVTHAIYGMFEGTMFVADEKVMAEFFLTEIYEMLQKYETPLPGGEPCKVIDFSQYSKVEQGSPVAEVAGPKSGNAAGCIHHSPVIGVSPAPVVPATGQHEEVKKATKTAKGVKKVPTPKPPAEAIESL